MSLHEEKDDVVVFKVMSAVAAHFAIREPVTKSFTNEDVLVIGYEDLDTLKLKVVTVLDGNTAEDDDVLSDAARTILEAKGARVAFVVVLGMYAKVAKDNMPESMGELKESIGEDGGEAIIVSMETFDKTFMAVFAKDENDKLFPISPVMVSDWDESESRIKDIVPHGAPEGVKLN